MCISSSLRLLPASSPCVFSLRLLPALLLPILTSVTLGGVPRRATTLQQFRKPATQKALNQLFDSVDLDKSGWLDLEEAAKALK